MHPEIAASLACGDVADRFRGTMARMASGLCCSYWRISDMSGYEDTFGGEEPNTFVEDGDAL